MDSLLHVVSKCTIDIQDAKAILLPASELIYSNSHVHDSITDHFGVVSEDSKNRTCFLVTQELLH